MLQFSDGTDAERKEVSLIIADFQSKLEIAQADYTHKKEKVDILLVLLREKGTHLKDYFFFSLSNAG